MGNNDAFNCFASYCELHCTLLILVTARAHCLPTRVPVWRVCSPEREVILLDEATNSLDVLSRAALLAFLNEESQARGCTVLFATHIFDGLDGWADQLIHLDGGQLLRHVSTADLPRGTSLYAVVSGWLRDHASKTREANALSGLPSLESIARALVDAAAAGDADESNEAWPISSKRLRSTTQPPQTSPPDEQPEGSGKAAGGGDSLPSGWAHRTATLSEGAFGSHRWEAPAPEGVPEGQGWDEPPTGGAGHEPPKIPLKAEPREQGSGRAELRETSAVGSGKASVVTERDLPPPSPPPPEPEAGRTRVSPPPPASLPPAARQMAPMLQGVLSMLNARVGVCSAAVGSGDGAAAAAAASEISTIWAQAQAALRQYELALGGGETTSAEPRVCGTSSGGEVGGAAVVGAEVSATPLSGGVPAGWGSRQSSTSEAELVRKGVILPQAPIS